MEYRRRALLAAGAAVGEGSCTALGDVAENSNSTAVAAFSMTPGIMQNLKVAMKNHVSGRGVRGHTISSLPVKMTHCVFK